ncbi:MAG: DUF6516 family protein [Acetobacteraceae bacterium]|nr:DUF6516 family protein [Acetobacteraceae bacterium]
MGKRKQEPRAELLFRERQEMADGYVLEMKLWRVPEPVPGSSHQLKYSLFYGRKGERTVGYDNEAGKGDHRHYGDIEEPYPFEGPEKLLLDFIADVERIRNGGA